MPGRLQDKVAIVTGGATGIGEAICKKFALEGARVIVNGLEGDPVQEVVEEITRTGGQATGFIGDVADEPQAQACVQYAIDAHGRLDVLINNAGIFLAVAETDAYPLSAFDQTLRNNVRSAFLMTHFALPHLRKTQGN